MDQRDGFAVVIALTLMGFMVLLILAVSSLLRVETASAEVSLDTLQARENALLALREAIGELQAAAGPDQRVTATADIDSTDTEEVENPHWTGVWQNKGNISATPGTTTYTSSFIQWLVSGEDGTVFNSTSVLNRTADQLKPNPDVDGNPVSVVWRGSAAAADTVAVPTSTIEDSNGATVGRFGWWVGDEGVKARLNLVDTESDKAAAPESGAAADTPAGRRRLAMPARTGIELMTVEPPSEPTAPSSPEIYPANDPFLEKVNTLQALPLVSAANQEALDDFRKNYFHEVTVHSVGLLTDTKNGGLKRDLTYALNLTGSDWDDFKEAVNNGVEGKLYPPIKGAVTTTDPGGPLWDQLKDFYNTRPENDGTVVAVAPKAPSPETYGIAPILVQAQFYVGASLHSSGADTGVRLHYVPVVVLWNPYDRKIVADDYYLAMGHPFMFQQTQVDININGADGETGLTDLFFSGSSDGKEERAANKPYSSPIGYDNAWNAPGFTPAHPSPPEFDRNFDHGSNNPAHHGSDAPYHFTIQAGDIAPGQAVVFTPPDDLNGVSYSPWPLWGNILKPGFRDRAHYYLDMPPIKNFNLNDPNFASIEEALINSSINVLKIQIPTEGAAESSVIMAFDPFDAGTAVDSSVGLEGPADEIIFFARQVSWWTLERDWWWDGVGPTGRAIQQSELKQNTTLNTDVTIQFGYFFGLRMFEEDQMGELNPNESIASRWLAHYNPRAQFFSRSALDYSGPSYGYRAIPNYAEAFLDGDRARFQYNLSANNNTGFSRFDSSSPTQSVLFRIFEDSSEIASIGDLMHANLFQVSSLSSYDDFENLSVGNIAGGLYPAFAIGNSLMPPYIDSEDPFRNTWSGTGVYTSGTPNSNYDQAPNHTYYDHSYLLNDALWDPFYFSTRDQSKLEDEEINDDDFNNSRIIIIDQQDKPQASGGHDLAATRLGVAGAFNVNSTSVDAWKAALGSFVGIRADNSAEPAADESLWTRVGFPVADAYSADNEYTSEDAITDEAHGGTRKLTEEEVDVLADEIVKVVRGRGPFLSMAHFVNRSLDGSTNNEKLKGPLQEAIDQSFINTGLEDELGGLAEDVDESVDMKLDASTWGDDELTDMSVHNEEALKGDRAFGLPGYLMQADILAKLGSVLTVRSDTFVVRAYGDVRDPISEKIVSQAWCEAVVQRMPEPVNPNGTNLNDPAYWNADLDLGRRFEIVQFRWLDRDEI